MWGVKLGSKLKVTNDANGKSVVVLVLDRGPHPRLKRQIDLSRSAFKRIASHRQGLIRVRIERVA
jgi:rare lipoprotein A